MSWGGFGIFGLCGVCVAVFGADVEVLEEREWREEGCEEREREGERQGVERRKREVRDGIGKIERCGEL